MKLLGYPLFGLSVLALYALAVAQGVEPFALATERRQFNVPTQRAGNHRTSFGPIIPILRHGGFGGK